MPEYNEDQLNAYLKELAELSRRYRFGITGNPVLFIMEHDDDQRVYACDAESNLTFC